MRKLLITAFMLNIALVLASCILLPDTVAIHFVKGGYPNSWASKELNALIFILIDVFLFLVFLYGPRMKLGIEKRYVNLPNKNYWLAGENKDRLKSILICYMNQFGIAMFAFMFGVGLFMIDANLSNPVRLNEERFLVLFVAFIVYVVYWTIKSGDKIGPG
jgi:hypothetical protein